MTLQAYSPAKLEKLALRLLDISALLRGIAKDLRSNQLDELKINDKKALLWCESMEVWAQKNRNNLDILLMGLPQKENDLETALR